MGFFTSLGGSTYTYDMFDTQIAILSDKYNQGFMGALSESSKSTTTPTRYPVEDASQVRSDHVHINPQTLSFSVVVSGNNTSTPQDVFLALRQLQESREPTTITTNLKSFDNMILDSVEGNVDSSANKAVINISATEVLVAGGAGGKSSECGGSGTCQNAQPQNPTQRMTKRRGRTHHKDIQVTKNTNAQSSKEWVFVDSGKVYNGY